jgi:dipeptidase E
MKKLWKLFLLVSITISYGQNTKIDSAKVAQNVDKTIFVYGGQYDEVFIKYVIDLTKKPNPKICFLPTASADNPSSINTWYATCAELTMRPYVLKTFVNSSTSPKSFEEILLDMDAIVVGGGNTLNMLAIWKAQGIDTVLKKAYDRGIILAGGSAGSLCWFEAGYSDSRPKELSIINAMGFLKFSHCPHFHSELKRRPLYHKAILKGTLNAGYAIDDQAGLLFVNGVVKKAVTQNATYSNSYFISVVDGKIKEEVMTAETIK